jgi:hypothetical protein
MTTPCIDDRSYAHGANRVETILKPTSEVLIVFNSGAFTNSAMASK